MPTLPHIKKFVSLRVHSWFKPLPRRAGFSLIELITVLTLFILLATISVGTFHVWKHASALRGAVQLTQSGLNRARQHAITRRVPTYFAFSETNNVVMPVYTYFVVYGNTNDPPAYIEDFPDHLEEFYDGLSDEELESLVDAPCSFPLNTALAFYPSDSDQPDTTRTLCFKPNGRAYDAEGVPLEEGARITVTLMRGGKPIVQTIFIDPLTGHTRTE